MELYNLYHTIGDTSSAQYSPYANPAVDRYMDQALASTDLEASYELWQLAQWDGTAGVTQEGDIPWVWLVNVDHLYWVRDGLRIAEQKIHPTATAGPSSTMSIGGTMSRMKWFGRSLLHLILLLLAVSLVSFLLVSMSPVDPLQTNVGQTTLGSMAPEQIEKLQAYWGVGVPVWKPIRRCISCKYKHGTDECNSHQKRDIRFPARRDPPPVRVPDKKIPVPPEQNRQKSH